MMGAINPEEGGKVRKIWLDESNNKAMNNPP